jgi:hypothetical protein
VVRAAAQRRLREHVCAASRGRRPRRHRRYTLAGVVACAVVAGVSVVAGLNGGDVTTPPASARAAVERAARAALGGGVSSLRPGQFLYIKERDAYTSTFADLRGGPFSLLVPKVRETWIGRDGRGRIVERATGRPEFVGPRDRERWEAAGRPPLGDSPAGSDTMSFDNGGFGAGSSTLDYEQLAALPSDGEAMYRRLIELAGDAGPSPDAEAFTIIGDLLRSAPVPPAARAGLFRAAAYIKGVKYLGEVKDPLGRRGLALELANATGRNRLIFDPSSSQILAEETVLTKRIDSMDGRPGAVVGSRVVLDEAVVGTAGARPKR